MATEDRILRALLRLETDVAALRAAESGVRDLEDAVDDLGGAYDRVNKRKKEAEQARFGQISDVTRDRLEFLGDGFEQLNDTLQELGIETEGAAEQALRAAGSLSRINSDPIGAAVNAIGMAIQAFKDFIGVVEQGGADVQDAWSEFFDKRQGKDAVELAKSYNSAQMRVAKAHEEGGIIADLFVDKAGVVNANLNDLARHMVQGATDYPNYVAGIKEINGNLFDQERAINLLSQEQFENQRRVYDLMDAYAQGNATITELADAVAESVGNLGIFNIEFAEMARNVADGVTKMEEAAAQAEAWPQALDAYIQFQEDMQASQDKWLTDRMEAQDEHNAAVIEAEEELGERREAIASRYADEIASLEEQLGQDLASLEERTADERQAIMQEFSRAAAQAEADYYRRRQELAESYGLQAARAEEDHQRRIQRMREDFRDRENDAIASRDALALIRARRDYDKQRSRADEDYELQQRRRAEDYACQLAELQANFERQQAERQAEYERQLAELEESQRQEAAALQEAADERLEQLQQAKEDELQAASDAYVEELNRLREHFDQRTTIIDQRYQDERNRLNRAFSQQLADLNANLLGEQEMRRQIYAAMSADLQTWLQANQDAARDILFGGSSPASNPTADAANNNASGPGGAGPQGASPQGVNLNARFSFAGSMSPPEQNAARTWVYGVLSDVLSHVETSR